MTLAKKACKDYRIPLLAVLIFGVIIIIHELGHFLTAKAAGVAVPEFSIGMGPKLFQIKHK